MTRQYVQRSNQSHRESADRRILQRTAVGSIPVATPQVQTEPEADDKPRLKQDWTRIPVRNHDRPEGDRMASREVQNIGETPARSPLSLAQLSLSAPVQLIQAKLTMDEKKSEAVQREGETPVQPMALERKAENKTGLPDRLKAGIENLSGMSMDDVKVHYNSWKPARLQALAYTQGTEIHVAPGQEKYLPHEAWHVVQQKQGRVQPTMQLQGVGVNDDSALEHEADVKGKQASLFALRKKEARSPVTGQVGRLPINSNIALETEADIRGKQATTETRTSTSRQQLGRSSARTLPLATSAATSQNVAQMGGLKEFWKRLTGKKEKKAEKSIFEEQEERLREVYGPEATEEEKEKFIEKHYPKPEALSVGKNIREHDLANDEEALLTIIHAIQKQQWKKVRTLPDIEEPISREKRLALAKSQTGKGACNYVAQAMNSYLHNYHFEVVRRDYRTQYGRENELLDHYFLKEKSQPGTGNTDNMLIVDPTWKQIAATEGQVKGDHLAQESPIFMGTITEMADRIKALGGTEDSAKAVMNVYKR
ncbi:MAG: DUF4157 domain-containing protein [Hormoscilla sp. GUM202]|nr:DUF4157 domain-containing protein [Hormoscilla sp. GUM202]